jgi:hypothetical protein
MKPTVGFLKEELKQDVSILHWHPEFLAYDVEARIWP